MKPLNWGGVWPVILLAYATAVAQPAATQPAHSKPPPGSVAPQAPEAATPERGPDGRVVQTLNPRNKAFNWETPEERDQLIAAAKALRSKLLALYPPPQSEAVRVPDGSIKIDGYLDEPAWKLAPEITSFREVKSGEIVSEQTHVRLLWDSKYLYIGAVCDDSCIVATETDHDGAVYNDDAFEVFINPSGDEMSYLEFEINALGVWYDGTLADYRPEASWLFMGHLNTTQSAKTFDTKDSKWAVTVDGTVKSDDGTNATDKPDKGWTAEIAIAWSDIARGTNVIHEVPQVGDIWRMNPTRVNVGFNQDNKLVSVNSVWNPTSQNSFHNPWLFGRIKFVDKATAAAPSQSGAPVPATQPGKD